MNTLQIFQIGKDNRVIGLCFHTASNEITADLLEMAESALRSQPQCQASYFDLLLSAPNGTELDFETHILGNIIPTSQKH